MSRRRYQWKLDLADQMRRNPTAGEKAAKKYLDEARRLYGWPRAQWQALLFGYIADAVMVHGKIVIEIDGDRHKETVAYDARRDAVFRAYGYKVFRILNEDIFNCAQLAFKKLSIYLSNSDLLVDPSLIKASEFTAKEKPRAKGPTRVRTSLPHPVPGTVKRFNRGPKVDLVCDICFCRFQGYRGSDYCSSDCTLEAYNRAANT